MRTETQFTGRPAATSHQSEIAPSSPDKSAHTVGVSTRHAHRLHLPRNIASQDVPRTDRSAREPTSQRRDGAYLVLPRKKSAPDVIILILPERTAMHAAEGRQQRAARRDVRGPSDRHDHAGSPNDHGALLAAYPAAAALHRARPPAEAVVLLSMEARGGGTVPKNTKAAFPPPLRRLAVDGRR